MRRSVAAVFIALACAASQAQVFESTPDPDWREAAAPPPPALRTEGLILLETPGSQLRFGVDPASIHVGQDGVVHYVVVATSSTGAVNGIYEGIRCQSAEYKVYARHTPGAGWVATKEAQWLPMHEQASARHSLIVARTGACMGRGAKKSAAEIARDLRNPLAYR